MDERDDTAPPTPPRTAGTTADSRAGRALRPAWGVAPAAVLAVLAVLPGCDPSPAGEVLLGAPEREEFGIASVNVVESVLPAGEDLVVRFTADVDPGSVGPRSVSVVTSRRRRISGATVRVSGAHVRVPGDLLANLADGETATLRVEGGASPCAVRSRSGETLAARYVLAFRTQVAGPADFEGPALTDSHPADGATEVPPGTSLELRFSEPVAPGSADWADAVTLRVDGRVVPARMRLSADRRRLVVRAHRPFAAGSDVAIDVHRSVTDAAGNPLAATSQRSVRFRVSATAVHRIEEDFACDEFEDRTATDCAWGAIEAPGVLAPRCGAVPLAALAAEPTTDLGDRDEIRFQVKLLGSEVAGGLACGLRLRFAEAPGARPIRAVVVEGAVCDDEVLGPSFQANRDGAPLDVLARRHGPADGTPDGRSGAVVDVPFERPLSLDAGRPVLLDVTLALNPGSRLGAVPDEWARALVRGASRERLLPCATLLVSGAAPSAQSLWYDTGDDAPRWRTAAVEADGPGRVAVEFQTAPADAYGAPDEGIASAWETDLAHVPAWRFVRFRVRFPGSGWDGPAPNVDRIVLPYER